MSDAEDSKQPKMEAEAPEAVEAPKTETAPEGEVEGEAPAEAPERDPEAEIAELKDRLLRAVAETENLRRRGARELDEARKYAMTGFARDMLAVGDNLRRAIESVPAEDVETNPSLKTLIDGVEMTEKELLGILDRHKIKRIEPLGEKFDANFHQAMFEAPVPGADAGTVIQVVQPGYVIADRLLRPAMVGIAKAMAPSEGEPPAEGGSVDTTA